MSTKRNSDAFLAASAHWAKRAKHNDSNNDNSKPQKTPEIIEISSGEESEEPEVHTGSTNINSPSSTPTKSAPSPSLRLLYAPSYPENDLVRVNKDTVRIGDLVGSEDLSETYQFNFSVDLGFFFSFLHPKFITDKRKIMFITGSKLLDPSNEDTELIKRQYNISEVTADIPNRFGTHHTKMMINFFKDGSMEVVIMTANLRKIDFGGLTQAVWNSGRLQKKESKTKIPLRGERFQRDLMNYMKRYNKSEVSKLAERLKDYDFSPVTVELIGSTPGSYDLSEMTDESDIYGYGKLYQALKRNSLLLDNSATNDHKTYNVLAQVSAISYPFSVEKWATAGIFSHLLCPLIFSQKEPFKLLEPGSGSFRDHQRKHNYCPSIVYPTAAEVASSTIGFDAGQAIHFNYTQSFVHKNYYNQAIKPYLRKCNSSGKNKEITGREILMPHIKMYMCDNGDNWSSLRWVYTGSHNLSKQAWGSRKGNKFTSDDPSKYEISSYELGVLVFPEEGKKLVPVYLNHDNIADKESTEIPIRMPFKLPPVKYSSNDLPWSYHVSYGDSLKDKYGETFNVNK
ncbi:uncharacterized protein J8A68_003221 [[Candida] subhashii]|uniref:Tyrosyl-DNA phosphodiesterase 1 n=1 Tax=[Candida] subhashii TaxID=561895 RepID=A0A8J5QMF5_9ASCO|nr:uncharacterized protein J8A68_003221 [[Candida] subhashii]KAG7663221.1 hypothetical protein J8A68_003221 [[Candida] subhashii]